MNYSTINDGLLHRKLLIFSAVFDLTSTTAAAEALGLTQSAVSKSVAQLERELEVKLFSRSAQGLQPNRAAVALRRRVRWMKREIDFAVAEMEAAAELDGAEVVIGAGPVWSTRFLPAIIPEFYQEYPNIRLDLLTGSGDYFVPRLLDGKIDVYFGVLVDDLRRDQFSCPDLVSMRLQAFARKNHPIFNNPGSPLATISSFPWIGFSHHSSLDLVISMWCARKSLEYSGLSIRVMSLAAMIALAKSTDHVVFAVDTLSGVLRDDGVVLIPGTEEVARMSTGMAVRQSLADTKPIKKLQYLASRHTANTNGS